MYTRTYNKRQSIIAILLVFVMAMMMFLTCTNTVFAASLQDTQKVDASKKSNNSTNTVSTSQAYSNLVTECFNATQNKLYTLEGGGSIEGKDLWDGDKETKNGKTSITKAKDVKESEFQKLTSSAQREFVDDIIKASEDSIGLKGIEQDTVDDWWGNLQKKEGMGSRFLNVILEDTKPDFVSAKKIWKPFSGPVSTILGILALAVMAFVGIVMMCDIAYITLPPVRLFVSDDEQGEKIAKSKLFTHDAIYAVQKSESDSDSGSPKQALGIYFKRRVFALILLGICLLYLISGQLWVGVGYILDLVSGFLGF